MSVDVASFGCANVLPVRTIESSRELGWTSALVEHQQVLAHEEPFETLPTPDLTLVVMTRGEQRLDLYQRGSWQRATYRSGAVGMTPGGVTDRLRRSISRDAGQAAKVNIYIPRVFLNEAADHIDLSGGNSLNASLVAHGETDHAIRYVALALVRALREGASDLYVESAIRWLVVHILTFDRAASSGIDDGLLSATFDKRLNRALDYIHHHYADQFSIEQLASLCGISRFHFFRLFQRATGMTPYRYVQARRFEAATYLLASTDLAIGEVARRCGFQHPNHFSTQFINRFGLTPRDYRSGRQGHA